jgi:hypothetical protein
MRHHLPKGGIHGIGLNVKGTQRGINLRNVEMSKRASLVLSSRLPRQKCWILPALQKGGKRSLFKEANLSYFSLPILWPNPIHPLSHLFEDELFSLSSSLISFSLAFSHPHFIYSFSVFILFWLRMINWLGQSSPAHRRTVGWTERRLGKGRKDLFGYSIELDIFIRTRIYTGWTFTHIIYS